ADGICYPPMTRAVEVALPAGEIEAAAAPGPADPGSESLSPSVMSEAAVSLGESDSDPTLAASDMADGESDSDPIPDASADNAARTALPASALPAGGALGALLLALLGGLV